MKKYLPVVLLVISTVIGVGIIYYVSRTPSTLKRTHAAGNTYYVTTNGADSNSGSQSSPFGTIAMGLSVMEAGDVLYLREGAYNEDINSNNQTWPTGTSWNDAPQIAGYPGETAILHGFINPAADYIQYVIFKDFIIDGERTIDNDCVGGFGAYHHIRFQNMEMRNCLRSGITASENAHHLEVLNSHIHHNGNSHSYHGLYWTAHDSLLENLDVHDNASLGIQIQNASPGMGSNRNILRNSRFYNNVEQGIALDGVDNQVYNNLVYNNGTGLSIYPVGGQPPSSDRNLVYNNTFYGNEGEAISVGVFGGAGGANNNVIRNNIFYQNGGGVVLYDGASNTIIDHNIEGSDPQFANPAGGDFHLFNGSPGIDTGMALPEVPTDADGNTRPAGGAYDIGAYEFGATGGCPAPSGAQPSAAISSFVDPIYVTPTLYCLGACPTTPPLSPTPNASMPPLPSLNPSSSPSCAPASLLPTTPLLSESPTIVPLSQTPEEETPPMPEEPSETNFFQQLLDLINQLIAALKSALGM